MKHKLVLFALSLISIFTLKSLLHPGFYTSHDGEHQIIRLMHFHQGLKDGQFPVRWAGTALDGNGYPLFIFTYRLPFWIAELYYQLFPSLADAIKFAFIFSFIASGMTMYCLLINLTKNKLLAFSGAFLYLWTPYRFLDIFVRAALGEAFTFIFLPLIMLGLLKLSQNKSSWKWIVLTAFSISGLLLSHVMTLMIVSIPLFLWMMLWLMLTKAKIKYVVSAISSGALAILLTAYYWLPAFMEKSFTKFSSVLGSYYRDHFLKFWQLIYSKWLYGFSMPGTADDMMSFQMGIAQWLILAITITILMIILLAYLLKKDIFLKKLINLNKKQKLILFYLLVNIIIAITLTLPISDRFYFLINKIMVIDIPWKYLTVTTLIFPILFVQIMQSIKIKQLSQLLPLFIIIAAVFTNRNHLRVNEYVYKDDREYWQSISTSNEHSEYAPKDYIQFRDNKKDGLTIGLPYLNQVEITNKKRSENQMSFTAFVKNTDAWIISEIPKYPGWYMKLNGVDEPVLENQGNIAFHLKKGINNIELFYQDSQLISYLGTADNQLLSRTSNSLNFTSEVKS